jgi:microcompartment protein CcmK/EutM
MKIARVTGLVTATVKEPQLTGLKLLIVNVENGDGDVLEQALVVADVCGAGPGDMVLVLTGSAARIPSDVAGLAVDAAAVAVIDEIHIGG